MQLDKNKFALAAAGTMGIVSIFCAAVVSVAPDLAVTLFGWMVHLVNLEPANITLTSFLGGLAQVLAYSYIGAWLFAWLHNKFLKSTS